MTFLLKTMPVPVARHWHSYSSSTEHARIERERLERDPREQVARLASQTISPTSCSRWYCRATPTRTTKLPHSTRVSRPMDTNKSGVASKTMRHGERGLTHHERGKALENSLSLLVHAQERFAVRSGHFQVDLCPREGIEIKTKKKGMKNQPPLLSHSSLRVSPRRHQHQVRHQGASQTLRAASEGAGPLCTSNMSSTSEVRHGDTPLR